jgi:hypothetical protein
MGAIQEEFLAKAAAAARASGHLFSGVCGVRGGARVGVGNVAPGGGGEQSLWAEAGASAAGRNGDDGAADAGVSAWGVGCGRGELGEVRGLVVVLPRADGVAAVAERGLSELQSGAGGDDGGTVRHGSFKDVVDGSGSGGEGAGGVRLSSGDIGTQVKTVPEMEQEEYFGVDREPNRMDGWVARELASCSGVNLAVAGFRFLGFSGGCKPMSEDRDMGDQGQTDAPKSWTWGPS